MSMSHVSGVVLGSTPGAVVLHAGRLSRVAPETEPVTLAEGLEDVQYLSASPDGSHIAFWLRADECFHLMKATGEEVWSRRINTDRAEAHGICFSPAGEAVAFVDDYDSAHRLHLFEMPQGRAVEFGPSDSPIGYDAHLRAFIEDPDFLLNRGSLPSQPARTETGRLGTLNRDRELSRRLGWDCARWTSAGIQADLSELVMLCDRDLWWLPLDSPEPATMVAECVPEDQRWLRYRCALRVEPDLALIYSTEEAFAVLASRAGVLYSAHGVLSAALEGSRTLLHYQDGTVEVVQADGSTLLRFAPGSGHETVAAGLAGDRLRVVQLSRESGAFSFRSLALAPG